MTQAESILASRLLDQAAIEFHEHGCNDMDSEYFEGLSDAQIAELLDGYNAWHRGETGETCGDPTDDYIGMAHIGDDMWMAYLAAVVGRNPDQPSLFHRVRNLLDRIQPHLRHIPDVTHTEIEELRAALCSDCPWTGTSWAGVKSATIAQSFRCDPNWEPPDPPGWEGGFAENH